MWALASHGEIPRAREGEAQVRQAGPAYPSQTVLSPAAYYRPSLTAEYDEDSPGGDFDFFSNLVTRWEAAARLPGHSTRQVVVRSGENQGAGGLLGDLRSRETMGIKGRAWQVRQGCHCWLTCRQRMESPRRALQSCRCKGRVGNRETETQGGRWGLLQGGTSCHGLLPALGVVLGRGGGAIGHMLLPFRLGLGGPIGSGQQFFPWIHIVDLAGIVAHALEANHVQGILNGVTPAPTTTNADFARALASALGRPAFIPLPSIVVQAVFGRERAIMLLEGQKVVPRRTLATGYQYSFPELGAALKEVVA